MANYKLQAMADQKVKIAVATSEEAAKAYTDNDVIVFVVPQNGSNVGKIYRGGKPYSGGGGGDALFPEGSTTVLPCGALPANSQIGGLDAVSVLNLILNPDYLPYRVQGKLTLALPSGTSLIQEVGSTTPASSDITPTMTPTRVVATSTSEAKNRVPSSATISKHSSSNFDFEDVTDQEGSFVVGASAAYGVGNSDDDGFVKTSRGEKTKYIGGTESSRVDNDPNKDLSAYYNQNWVTSAYRVAGETVDQESLITIKYYYAIWATSGNNDTLVKQTLTDKTSLEITLKAGDGITTSKIAIPAGYSNVKFYEKDAAGQYVLDGDHWNTPPATESINDAHGTAASYKVYTRSSAVGATSKVKVTFTR